MWVFYKPANVETDLAPGSDLSRLVPSHFRSEKFHHIGRLDRDTSGLLLFSNDGQATHSLLSSPTLEKTYIARVSVEPRQVLLEQLIAGVPLGDGPARAIAVSPISEQDRCLRPLFLVPNFQAVADSGFFVRVVTCEGRNRIVRRMLASVGLPVLALHRERVGAISVSADLEPGTARALSDSEISSLVRLSERV